MPSSAFSNHAPSPVRSHAHSQFASQADQVGPIRAMTRQLSGQVHKLGELTALEILAAIGALWSENGR